MFGGLRAESPCAYFDLFCEFQTYMVATSGSRTLHQLHHLPGSTFHSGIHLVPPTFRCKQRKVHGLNLILNMSDGLNFNFIKAYGHSIATGSTDFAFKSESIR